MRIQFMAMVFAVTGVLVSGVTGRADVVLGNYVDPGAVTTSGSITLNNTTFGGSTNTTLNLTTNTSTSALNYGRASTINQNTATAGWGLSGVGAFSPNPSNSFINGYSSAAGQSQTVQTTSQSLTDFYFIFNWVDNGTYDFSSWTAGSVTLVGGTSGKVSIINKVVTLSGISGAEAETNGFMVKFSGTLGANSSFTYTQTSAADGTAAFNVAIAVPEPGTLLLGGIAAMGGGAGVFWNRRKKAAQPVADEVAAG
jgi:hypothetical protein